MNQLTTNQTEELRYERKFLITDYSADEVSQLIKLHPACFKEIYQERVVNNIYFDTLDFKSYYDNLDGDIHRIKTRIRWYGDLFGQVHKPILEFKIKKGFLGSKDFYPLSSFCVDPNFTKKEIVNALNGQVPRHVQDSVLSMYPALLNSYIRTYYISEDKNFRMTIDRNIRYFKIAYYNNTFLNKIENNSAVVLELKYHASLEQEAKEIGNKLPFMMTKNSKYLEGVSWILF
jgi:SPX domain protein involved in polyphosphate accumulation